MAPFTVGQFPGNYPALLAVSTSCFFRYNKQCILGICQDLVELTLEEGEVFLEFQKEVKKLLKRKCNYTTKCRLYEEIYQRYVSNGSEEKIEVSDLVTQEEEDDYFQDISMEETGSKKPGVKIEDV